MGLRDVLRRLWRAPMFTAITALTLALGIGANSAIFSVVEGILLKPLPYPEADRLVNIDHGAPGVNLDSAGSAAFLHLTYKEEGRTFQDVGLWQMDHDSVTGLAEPEQVEAINITETTLPILGIQPAIGRWFSAKDTAPGSPETVILAHAYWQRRFGGSRDAIGRRIVTDGVAREIIGVMPEGFRFLDHKPLLFIPMHIDRAKIYLGQFNEQAIGRLKPGVTLEQAKADAARMIPLAIERFTPPPGFSKKMFYEARLTPAFRPLKESIIGDLGKTLWILMATLGLVLLIACANVANLLLVRAEGRQHELSIRAALGAGWTRLAREILSESLTIGIIGGAIGLAFAYGALRALVAIAPGSLPRIDNISIDPVVVLFTLAVSIIAGLLFGLIPMVKYASPRATASLRAGGRSISASKERHRARSVLTVVQIALALVLLISSGLMIRTFQALRQVQPGFKDPARLQTMWMSISEAQVKDPEAVVRMEQNIIEKLRALPGVTSAALTNALPMTESGWRDPLYAEGKTYEEGKIPSLKRYKFTGPGLLATMGNSLVAGRDFIWDDVYQKRRVVMVSENLAREFWQSPAAALGKRVRGTNKEEWREVIGVVGDEREDGLAEKAPQIVYWPLLMEGFNGDNVSVRRTVGYVVRSNRTGTSGFFEEIRRAVWSVNPDLPIYNVRTLGEIYDKSLARTSFILVMLAIAGAMALLIGVVGVYGVISYSVSQRTREIGIRMALGARPSILTRGFVGHGLVLALIGVAFGVGAAFAVMRLLKSLLFEISPFDPVTYVAVSLGLIAAAVIASYIPAMRASSVDPVQALRAE
jgi:putative ABC transport system permease protein